MTETQDVVGQRLNLILVQACTIRITCQLLLNHHCGTGYNEAGGTMPVHCTSDMINFEVVLVLLLTSDNHGISSL